MADWEEGERVLAPWEPEWLYPGTIRCIDEDIAFIRFDDGDRALIPLSELRSVELKSGTRVQSRWQKSPDKLYTPAEVIDVLGEEIRLRYADGREERTEISYIRVPRTSSGFKPWFN